MKDDHWYSNCNSDDAWDKSSIVCFRHNNRQHWVWSRVLIDHRLWLYKFVSELSHITNLRNASMEVVSIDCNVAMFGYFFSTRLSMLETTVRSAESNRVELLSRDRWFIEVNRSSCHLCRSVDQLGYRCTESNWTQFGDCCRKRWTLLGLIHRVLELHVWIESNRAQTCSVVASCLGR